MRLFMKELLLQTKSRQAKPQQGTSICIVLICCFFFCLSSCADAEITLPAKKTEEKTTTKKQTKSNWTSYRNSNQLTGVASGVLPKTLDILWTFTTESGIASTAAIVDQNVFVGTLDGTVVCLNLKNGKTIWTYRSLENAKLNEFMPGFKSSPTVTATSVLLGDEDGVFHCINRKTGKKQWTFSTQGEIISSATLSGEHVLFGSYDNNLYCLDFKTGKKVWAFPTEGYVNCTPAIADGTTFVTGCDEKLRVIDIKTGKQKTMVELKTYLVASSRINERPSLRRNPQ